MTQLVAGPAGFNMLTLDIDMLTNGTVLTRAPGAYQIDLGTRIYSFTGTGFSYNSAGIPTGGIVTSLDMTTKAGELIARFTDMSIPATTFVSWATGGGGTVAALTTIFAGSDTLTASNNPAGSFLRGEDGDDLLTGGAYVDDLDGGAGNNTIFAGDGDDRISVRNTGHTNYVRAGAGNDRYLGSNTRDDVNGNQGDDKIWGSGGNDWLLGGQGNDEIDASAPFGPVPGNAIINGNLGNDRLYGGSGDDTVRGGQGDDGVGGGAGNDQLHGDLGNDSMGGGPGADTFHFSVGSGRDWIVDFNGEEGDRIRLDPGASYTIREFQGEFWVTLSSGDELFLETPPSFTEAWIIRG